MNLPSSLQFPLHLHGVVLKVVIPKHSRLRVALRCGQWWDLSLTNLVRWRGRLQQLGGQGSTSFATGPRGLLDSWSGVWEFIPITLYI